MRFSDFNEIDKTVEKYRDEIISVAQKLVQKPSENIVPTGYEKESQEYLQDILSKVSADIDVFTPDEVKDIQSHEAFFPGRDYTDRPNVVARRKGVSGGNSLILSSHVDVVTAKPLPWQIDDPYSGKVEDGKLFGRGSFDMKGGLVSTLFAMKILSDLDVKLEGDLIFESVVDEENGGSNGTLASRVKGYNADVAIIPEPSLLDVAIAGKGGRYYRIHTTGKAGTGYGGEAVVNPVYSLANYLQAVEKYEQYINEQANDPVFPEEKPRTVILDKVQAGDLERGGNIGIPSNAWFSVFINSLSDFTKPEDLDNELAEFLESYRREGEEKPEITAVTRYLYPYISDRNHPVVHLLSGGVKTFTDIDNPVVTGAKFACDGFIFKNYFDTETYIFGPRGGNAHAQDEFVYIDDLIQLTKIYIHTAVSWCSQR